MILIRWHFYKGIFIQAGVEDVIGYTNRMYMVGVGIRFKPSDLGKLANNMEKENTVKKTEQQQYKNDIENEPLYQEYKNTKSNQAKESKTVKDNKEPETVKQQNTTQKNESNDIKKQDKINESNEFFDSLVY